MSDKIKLLFLTVAAAVLLSGCNNTSPDTEIIKPIGDDFSVSYNTAVADYITFEKEEKIPANVTFAEYKEFYAPFSAIVKTVSTSKNSKVKAGDPLFALDTTDIDFKINELQIKVEAASSANDKEAYRIQLEKLQKQRDAAIIVAPYDGIINQCLYLVEGSTVNEGDLICSVAKPDSVYVYNDQGAGRNLRFNMDVKIKINNIDYNGKVIAAPNTAPSDASSNVFKFCAAKLNDEDYNKFLNEDDGLASADAGWATIYAVTVKRINVLAVPLSAVKKENTSAYCTILRNGEKYDLPVEIGAESNEYIEIMSGLNKGDVVILP